MAKFIVIQADTNDGDYVTNKLSISEEDILKFTNILNKITDDHYDLSWGTLDMKDVDNDPESIYPQLTKEEIDFVGSFLPSADYGIHTIESIEIIEVVDTIKLL